MRPAVPMRAKIAGAALGVGLLIALVVATRGERPAPAVQPPHEPPGPPPISPGVERRSMRDEASVSPAPQPVGSGAALPPEVIERLEKGPTSPLVPPEIRVEVEPGRGAAPSPDPLTPPTIDLGEIEPGRGARHSGEALVPPVIAIEGPAVPPSR